MGIIEFILFFIIGFIVGRAFTKSRSRMPIPPKPPRPSGFTIFEEKDSAKALSNIYPSDDSILEHSKKQFVIMHPSEFGLKINSDEEE